MTIRTKTFRRVLPLIAVAAFGGLAAPAALADPPQGHPATAPPDLVERYVISERAASVGQGAAIPDLVERAVARGFDPRPVRPDDRAGARPVAISEPTSPVVALPGDGFEWGDATLGAAFTIAALLLAGALAVTIRQRRRIALS